MENILLILFAILLTRTDIQCSGCLDIAYSTSQIPILISTQQQVILSIEDYVTKERERLQVIERFLNDTADEHGKASADVSEYMANPINALRLIRRLQVDMEHFEAYMPARVTVYRKNPSVYYPVANESLHAANGIIHLQIVYKLQASDLADGILKSTFSKSGKLFKEYVSPMTSSDCFYLGLVSYENVPIAILTTVVSPIDTKRKLRWMLEAHKKYQRENCTICPVEEVAIMDHISKRYQELGDLKNSMLWIQKRMALKPNDLKNENFTILLEEMQTILNTALQENTPKMNAIVDRSNNTSINTSTTNNLLKSICYRNSGVPSRISKRLTCYFAHGPHPYLRLARLKAEKLYRNPDITLYYDTLSDGEIHRLRTATKVSKPSPAQTAEQVNNYRTGKNAMIYSNDENRWIFNRVAQITNLNVMSQDVMEMLNYGIGGHYSSHTDYYVTKSKFYSADYAENGDRQASIVFYLSDVEQGGATAFAKIGVLVYPVKGAALVWNNLYPSGDGHPKTVHESCPVLRGSKWIIVKWLREGQQTSCPIWHTKDGLMTEDKYLRSNIRQPFRDAWFKKMS